jgi:hypothetical protein
MAAPKDNTTKGNKSSKAGQRKPRAQRDSTLAPGLGMRPGLTQGSCPVTADLADVQTRP